MTDNCCQYMLPFVNIFFTKISFLCLSVSLVYFCNDRDLAQLKFLDRFKAALDLHAYSQ